MKRRMIMLCPNCGRELAEGEVCTCTAEVPVENTEIIENSAPASKAPAAEAPAAELPPVQEAEQAVPPQAPPQQEYYRAEQAQYMPPQYVPPGYQQAAPVKQPPKTDYPEGYRIKRKYVAVILAAFLGVFGIHNFYLGDSTKGVIHILVATLGSLLAGLGLIASLIWAIVEAVQILTEYTDRDSEGYKIQTFEEALVKTRMEAEKKDKCC